MAATRHSSTVGLYDDELVEQLHIAAWCEVPSRDFTAILRELFGALCAGPLSGRDRAQSAACSALADQRPPGATDWTREGTGWSLSLRRQPMIQILDALPCGAAGAPVHWVLLGNTSRRGSERLRYFGHSWGLSYEVDRFGTSHSAVRVSIDLREFACSTSDTASVEEWFAESRRIEMATNRFVHEVLAVLLRLPSLYGVVVNTSDVFETDGGSAFMPSWGYDNYASIEEQIRRRRWRNAGESRSHLLRGVYWGMLLNPQHLNALGGRAAFVARFLAHPSIAPRPARDAYIRDMGEPGVFLQLTPSPVDFSRSGRNGMAVCDDYGAWVFEQFQRAGILA